MNREHIDKVHKEMRCPRCGLVYASWFEIDGVFAFGKIRTCELCHFETGGIIDAVEIEYMLADLNKQVAAVYGVLESLGVGIEHGE